MANTSVQQARAIALIVTATGAGAVLAAFCRPDQIGSAPDDPTSAVVTAAAWVAWACLGYLAAAVAVTAAGHLPHLGRALVALQPVAPDSLRRWVATTVGATVAAGVALASAPAVAAAAPGPLRPRPPVPVVATASPLEWPGLPHSPPAHPVASTHPAPPVRLVSPAAPRPQHGEVVVRAGDSLWSITARALGPAATPAQIAAAWPRLYATNRSVIGPNPDLIQPGQRLVLPDAAERTP